MNSYISNLSQINAIHIQALNKSEPPKNSSVSQVSSDSDKTNEKILLTLAGLAVVGGAIMLGAKRNKACIESIKTVQNTVHFLSDKKPLEKFDNLCDKEKEALLQAMENDRSINSFFSVKNGQKPSVLLVFKDNNTASILDKLKDDDFDIVSVKDNDEYFRKVILNKKLTVDIIENNKELFKARLGIDHDIESEKIYEKLIGKNGLLENNPFTVTSKCNDMAGIILGYPKISSMIFELEQRSGLMNGRILSKNFTEYSGVLNEYKDDLFDIYKSGLIDTLYGDNSPYKTLGEDFLENLASHINAMDKITNAPEDIKNMGYVFVRFVEEPQEIARIREYSNLNKAA